MKKLKRRDSVFIFSIGVFQKGLYCNSEEHFPNTDIYNIITRIEGLLVAVRDKVEINDIQ